MRIPQIDPNEGSSTGAAAPSEEGSPVRGVPLASVIQPSRVWSLSCSRSYALFLASAVSSTPENKADCRSVSNASAVLMPAAPTPSKNQRREKVLLFTINFTLSFIKENGLFGRQAG